MTSSLTPGNLHKKKLVIGYIKCIIDRKSQEEYQRRRNVSITTRSPILSAIGYVIYLIKYKLFRIRQLKSKHRTISSANSSTDFLVSLDNFGTEAKEMEKYINEIIIRCDDKKILEECENYLSRNYKIHLARISPVINILALIFFAATIITLGYILGYFPISEVKTNITNPNSIDSKIIIFLVPSIAVLTASTAIANALLLIYKPFVEDSQVASTSAYEYCLELLKNARLRVS